jgi:hypothetical protein
MSIFKGEVPEVGSLKIVNHSKNAPSASIFYGSAVTRATAAAEVDGNKQLPIGSLYISSGAGSTTVAHVYIKIAATGTVANDWARVTVSAAD